MDLSSGVSNLLPPSPSVVSPIHRSFALPPLNTNLDTGNAIAGEHPHPHPHPHPSTTPVPPLGGEIHAHPDVALMAPEIRPLNFMSFVASSDETHVELERTVDELSRWLAVVEGGVVGVLESLRGWRKDIGSFRRSWKGDEKERDMGGG
jgi:hypothetical protein